MAQKQMAFAGSWYPGNLEECKTSISGFLNEKQGPLSGPYIGGIVPHAGWFFSGSIACRVIASLKSYKSGSSQKIDYVLLFGGHMHPDAQPFVLSGGSVATPLGDIQVAREVVDTIVEKTGILKKTPEQFPDENTLELQYPFIKHFFPDANIVACCVPPSRLASSVGKIAGEAARELSPHIRVIGSTDMTHYGPNFGFTPAGIDKKAVEWVKNENDKQAIQALLEMDESKIISQGLNNMSMCCAGAAAATVAACKANGAASALALDYATSYEKSADTSFVGYSGILYSKDAENQG